MTRELKAWDRGGAEITLLQWSEAYADLEYRHVGQTIVGEHQIVSTVWEGGITDGPAYLFKTAVFVRTHSRYLRAVVRRGDFADHFWPWRMMYEGGSPTEAEALRLHRVIVRTLRLAPYAYSKRDARRWRITWNRLRRARLDLPRYPDTF